MEKLNSPDRSDELFRVTSSGSWLILMAVFLIVLTALLWGFMGTVVTSAKGPGIINHPVEIVCSPVDGTVDSVYVNAGETAPESGMLMKIRPVYSENHFSEFSLPDAVVPVRSPFEGTVVEIRAGTGRYVRASEPLVTLQNCELNEAAPVCFFIGQGYSSRLKAGMEIRIKLPGETGGMLNYGILKRVSPFPASYGRLMDVFHNEVLSRKLSDANSYECEALLNLPGAWTRDEVIRYSGIICEAEVVIERRKPFSLIFR